MASIDGVVLGIDLPKNSESLPELGRKGLHDAMDSWPDLPTGTLGAGAVNGDATMIRVEMKVSRFAWPCFYPATVTFTSVADPARSDTVKVVAAVKLK